MSQHVKSVHASSHIFFSRFTRRRRIMPKTTHAPGRARARPPRAAVTAVSRRRASTPRAAAAATAPAAAEDVVDCAGEPPVSSAQLHEAAGGGAGLFTVTAAELQQLVGDMVQSAMAAAGSAALPPAAAHTPPVNAAFPFDRPATAPASFNLAGNVHQVAVSASLRHQITGHRYVDLGSLLDNSDPSPDGSDGVFHLIDGKLRPARHRKSVTTFSAWCIAFLRFAGVYLSAHPHDAMGVIGHMQQVGSLHAPGLGFAWREFDEQFRRARELQPAVHVWGATTASSPLWLHAVARGIAGQRASPAPAHPVDASMPPRPICFSYNRPGGCTRTSCPYLHACRTCQGSHTFARCPRRSQPVNSGSSKQARK